MGKQRELWNPVQRPLHRSTDPGTSRDAGEAQIAGLGSLQQKVLLAYLEEGPMTGFECERLRQFRDAYGPSTIRKRISELADGGYLVACGVKRPEGARTRSTVYRLEDAP